jgi:glucose-6-phosphate 1-epimerase
MTDLRELQAKLGTSGIVRAEAGNGSLIRLVVNSELATAQIYLHGAHLAHFQPRGAQPLLFMSGASLFQPDKPIRGGVPVIFPWFGARAGRPADPPHGFARLREWQLESSTVAADGSVRISLTLNDDEQTRRQWPFAFGLRLNFAISAVLEIAMEVSNPADQPIEFEQALHTYLSVGDVRQATVEGLDGVEYLDRVGPPSRKTQPAEAIRFVGETDRLYLHTTATTVVRDPVLGRAITVEKAGSDATVVWNPWIAKAKAMADFGDDEWPRMLCIETANAAQCAVRLAPRSTHRMMARIRIGA